MKRRSRQLLRPPAIAAVVAIATMLLCTAGAGPAAAEDPGMVAEEVADDGVFVAPTRSDVDEDELEAVVRSLRFQALRVVVVVPDDPQPTNSAYARRIQEATDADVAIIFPPAADDDSQGAAKVEAFAIEDLQDNQYRALQKAREFSDPARAVEVYAQEIQADRDPGRPPIVGQMLWALALMVVGLIAIFAIERSVSRDRLNALPTDQKTLKGPGDGQQTTKVATASSKAR